MYTVFFEMSGQNARTELWALQGDLESLPEVREATLLESCDDTSRYLLVCRCERTPQLQTPTGARVWTFREAPT